jgi:excisionase family DNA binding protein
MEKTPCIKTAPAAKHCGICRRTFERIRDTEGTIPFYKIGGQYLYRVEELDRWINSKRVASREEAIA